MCRDARVAAQIPCDNYLNIKSTCAIYLLRQFWCSKQNTVFRYALLFSGKETYARGRNRTGHVLRRTSASGNRRPAIEMRRFFRNRIVSSGESRRKRLPNLFGRTRTYSCKFVLIIHTHLRTCEQKTCCTLRGHTSTRILSRCCVFAHHTTAPSGQQPDKQGRPCLVAAPDEKDNSTLLWNCIRGVVHQRLSRHGSPVLDVKASPYSDTHPDQQLLCTLSASAVNIYGCVC